VLVRAPVRPVDYARYVRSPLSLQARLTVAALSQSDVPQFVLFTADDAIQSYTLDAVNQFLAQRKNPNGCPVKMTYFTSLSYTNYTLVTGAFYLFPFRSKNLTPRIDWYVAGNEIADHT